MSISAIRNFCNLNATQLINNSYARKWGWNLGLKANLPSWIAAGVLGGIQILGSSGWNIEVVSSKVTLSFSISLTLLILVSSPI
jgi:hypothetical protein